MRNLICVPERFNFVEMLYLQNIMSSVEVNNGPNVPMVIYFTKFMINVPDWTELYLRI